MKAWDNEKLLRKYRTDPILENKEDTKNIDLEDEAKVNEDSEIIKNNPSDEVNENLDTAMTKGD